MIAATSFAWDLLHPLRGDGYQFWSGIAGSFLTSLPGWTVAGVLFWRHHNCGEHGCLRLGHAHPDHGRPVCRHHFHSTDAAPISQP